MLTCGMPDAQAKLPIRVILKHDDFLHHHSVSILVYLFVVAMSITTSILQFLSPRASKVLSPVCTLPHSASSSTVFANAYDKDAFDQIPEVTHESICSPGEFYSNQRTRNQFRPRNATKGTTSYQLRQYAEATLGGGSLRKIVKLPEGEDENEWLAVNSTTPKIS